MKYYIGIDLGGTNVRVARVDEEGNILFDLIEPYHKYFNGIQPAEVLPASLKESGVLKAAMLVVSND